jgi:competence protein ComEC
MAGRGRTATSAWTGVVLALLTVTASGLALSARLADRHDGPVAQAAATGAAVTLEVVVTGDPRATGRGGVVVPARADTVTLRGTVLPGAAPVLVVAGSDWRSVRWDGRYAATGLLSLPRERADGYSAVFRPRSPPRPVATPGWPWRAAGHVRDETRVAAAPLPGPAPGLLPSLALGDTSGMDDDLVQRMRDSGLAHLSAVSGANVTIVCGGLVAVLAWLRFGVRWQIAAGAAALAALVVTARPEPSVLRAAVMGSVGLLGLLAGRPGRAPPAVCAAVLLLLAVDPWLSRSYGFALSVVATTGIVIFGRPLARRLRHHVPRPLADPLAVTAVAQACVTPVLVLLDPVLTPYALAANLAVGPVVAPTMVLATVSAAVSPLSTQAATAIAWPAAGGAWWIVRVADVAAGAPAARIPWPPGVVGALLAAAVVAVIALLVAVAGRRGVAALLALVVVAGLVAVPGDVVHRGSWVPADWGVVVCDVGQGEALLVRAGPDAAVVVDTGPEPAPLRACLGAAGVRQVPLLVITHVHSDHVGGVAGLLEAVPVAAVWHGPSRAPGAADAIVTLERGGVRADEVGPGHAASVGDLRIRVLWPSRVLDPAGVAAGDGTAVNDEACVVRVDGPGPSVLALGDIETAAQVHVARLGPDLLGVDVTTIAHHGSLTQVPGLYARIGAELAVASAGADNSYGHPAPETLAAVAATGAHVVTTAEVGGVAVSVRGEALHLSTAR